MGWQGNYPTGDQRGQGGGDRDTYRLPHEGMEQAKFAAKADSEGEASPGLLSRLKNALKRLLPSR